MISFYNIDCMEFMRDKPDKCYDLAIVDPPYGIDVAKMAYTQAENRPCKQKNGRVLRVKKLKYKHGDWDKNPPTADYFIELMRVSKHQIIWGVNYFDSSGWGTGRIKWDKGVPDGVSFNKYEYAYCSLIDYEYELPLLWAGMCQAKSLSEPMTQQGNKKLNEKRIHPTHKPIKLYQATLLQFGEGVKTVLDTHGGGMSIAIVADELGFDLDICEIDKEYFDGGVKRFKIYKSQGKLFNN